MLNVETLRHGNLELDIAPDAGGGIARLHWQGLALLRDAVTGAISARDPLGLSCFPMTPYVSRITDGAFTWGDVTTHIAPNMAGGAHPLHGIGWRKPWMVIERAPGTIILELSHSGDADWPWAFVTRQKFELQGDQLIHTLSVTSKDARPFPCSLGPHPYFNAQGATIQFQAGALWEISGESLPTHKATPRVVAQLAQGVGASSLDLDHCFEGWDGRATISWANFGVHIDAKIVIDDVEQDCTRLQLYTPKGMGFFCLEPVTARCVSFLESDPFEHGVVEMRDQTVAIITTITPFR